MDGYRISEVARRFGLSRSALLYYDRIGLLRPEDRTSSDYRSYSEQDVERLERVRAYRETGLALSEIALLLEDATLADSLLERRLRAIAEEIAGLRTQQRLIAGMLRTASVPPESSGLDRELWNSLKRACTLDEKALGRWHSSFERMSPQAHHAFLEGLGLSEREAIQVRMLTRDVERNGVEMEYFHELFDDLPRQGPGCAASTLRALSMVERLPPRPRTLDIACGSGLPTRLLARRLKTTVVAIDDHAPLLERLSRAARRENLSIETRAMSMTAMDFEDEAFDLVWGEGALFIVGLERGLREIRRLLPPGGHLAFTELCWFTADPPEDLASWFGEVYPEIRSVDAVRSLAAACGYEVVGSFQLPEEAWWDDYYAPMLERMQSLRARNAGVPEAESVYTRCEKEVEMFWKHSAHYGYAFFVLRRPDAEAAQ